MPFISLDLAREQYDVLSNARCQILSIYCDSTVLGGDWLICRSIRAYCGLDIRSKYQVPDSTGELIHEQYRVSNSGFS